jgi:general secretion pathway protein H
MMRAPTPNDTDCDRGFTLVETMVVLAVLALAVIVVLPQTLGARQHTALRSAANDLAAELRATRALAMRRNSEEFLVVDTATGSYSHADGTTPRTLPAGQTVTLTTIRSEQTGPGSGRIRFYPDGSATGGRIVLAGGGRTMFVTVDWLTGGTRVDMDR